MDIAMRTAVLICIAATLALGVFYLSRAEIRMRKEDASHSGKDYSFTVADYHADLKCDICFDDIGDECVSECTCGKVFHRSCAEPTGECPYCGTPFDRFREPRAPRHVTCPRCGSVMSGNICRCGTVVPDSDGTFLCRCGERVAVGEKMCRKCGRTFGSDVYKVSKGFIPSK